ncbi:hypothetical protein VM98_07565 [Streptomyces rubellomurinus subsp. indigoferus]|nr:hypothetical protein VM98_07565 [Streptomyces rubellomurinus subsp. indigoferus]
MTAPAYLPGMSSAQYLAEMAVSHPRLRALLDPDRLDRAVASREPAAWENEFDSDSGGRGDSYRRAQRDPLVRWTGVRRLLGLTVPAGRGREVVVLDVLGGDGTVARAAALRPGESPAGLEVLTGDISGPMVAAALANGLPAVRQAADRLLLADDTVDAVLLAYGTHHIPDGTRPQAVAEALRVVRPGGRVVLHDFAPDSAMADFFRVVSRHGTVRHDYAHFTHPELRKLFEDRCPQVRVLDVYDPFTVLAPTPDRARAAMVAHMGESYGLAGHFEAIGPDAAWQLLAEAFDHTDRPTPPEHRAVRPTVRLVPEGYVAELPRVAVVAVAEKPGA